MSNVNDAMKDEPASWKVKSKMILSFTTGFHLHMRAFQYGNQNENPKVQLYRQKFIKVPNLPIQTEISACKHRSFILGSVLTLSQRIESNIHVDQTPLTLISNSDFLCQIME